MSMSSIRKLCDWPRGFFKMRDDPDPHGHTWMILPDGQMIDVSHHNDPSVNPAQVSWMVEVLNQALEREDNPPNAPTSPGGANHAGQAPEAIPAAPVHGLVGPRQ